MKHVSINNGSKDQLHRHVHRDRHSSSSRSSGMSSSVSYVRIDVTLQITIYAWATIRLGFTWAGDFYELVSMSTGSFEVYSGSSWLLWSGLAKHTVTPAKIAGTLCGDVPIPTVNWESPPLPPPDNWMCSEPLIRIWCSGPCECPSVPCSATSIILSDGPNNYLPNSDCKWVISSGPSGKPIHIQFTSLRMGIWDRSSIHLGACASPSDCPTRTDGKAVLIVDNSAQSFGPVALVGGGATSDVCCGSNSASVDCNTGIFFTYKEDSQCRVFVSSVEKYSPAYWKGVQAGYEVKSISSNTLETQGVVLPVYDKGG